MRVELDKAMRDELYGDLMYRISYVGEMVTFSPTVLSGPTRTDINSAAAILDQIGWEREDDRETYVVEMPHDFLSWWPATLESYIADEGPEEEWRTRDRLLAAVRSKEGARMTGTWLTVELDAPARDELWYDMLLVMDDALGEAFRLLSGNGDPAALRQGAMRATDAAAIVEQIGWAESDDRETFTVRFTGAFAEWWIPETERYVGERKHDHGLSDEHVIQTVRLLSIIGDAKDSAQGVVA